jgi:hypothetical protein
LSALQRQIRASAEKADEVALSSLVKQRTELALQQYSFTVRLMQHVTAVRNSQSVRHSRLLRLLSRVEAFHRESGTSFLLSDASGNPVDDLLSEKTSECTPEEWAQLVEAIEAQAKSSEVTSEQADAAMSQLSSSLQQQASVALQVAGWIDGTQVGEAFDSAAKESPAVSSDSTATRRMSTSIRDPHTYEQLSNNFQDSGEGIERCCVDVKVKVESELGAMSAKESTTKSLLRSAVEKGYGLIKAMITQNRMAMMEQTDEKERIQRWQVTAACLLQADEIRKRCDLLVSVNAVKEDELLQLEGDRIDRRSSLEKALLQGSRRTQMRSALPRPPSSHSHDLSLGTPSLDALDATLSSISTDSASSRTMDELKAGLVAAERAVKDARRGIRAWYRDVRKLALELTPELFKLIPDLQMPGSILGDGGFAQNAKVPHRLFDDYDN